MECEKKIYMHPEKHPRRYPSTFSALGVGFRRVCGSMPWMPFTEGRHSSGTRKEGWMTETDEGDKKVEKEKRKVPE